ncbi:MAG: dihydrofolate reductase [Gammaproteobacteria bacterium]
MQRPRTNIIVAMAENGAIGRDGDLPWRISADLKRFKSITMGHPIIMGRKTYESLPRGPLPGRQNIIITRQADYEHEQLNDDCVVVDSFINAINLSQARAELMVIGGAAIYAEALATASRIFLTEVHAEINGDVYFPDFARRCWTETLRLPRQSDDKSGYEYSFVVLEKA